MKARARGEPPEATAELSILQQVEANIDSVDTGNIEH
jgi:hypothetical protein